MALETGTRLGNYEVVSLLGRGGMGDVYKALDRRLDRQVAIKVLQQPSPDLRQRFDREARVVAALQHPRICTLIDVGVHDGADYFVMEYLEGRTLSCPQPLPKVIEYGIQIADALDAAGSKGITHRDLKPANIIVTGSGIKLLDFGIAKADSFADTATRPGVAVGTPAYMAPEQWRGTGTDHRTDIYALGCVLYEMATGKRLGDEPIPHPRLEWVVRGCVAAEPDDRWQSARDVRRLLESVKTVHDAVPPGERWSWLWLAAMAIAGLAGIAAAWMLKPPAPLPPYHLSIAPPPNTALLLGRSREGGVAVSPDGRTIAFAALTAGKAQLWTRRLDSFEAQPVPGTDGAFYPFWSPDSRWIAFFTPDRLMKVAVAGGPPQMVCVTDPRSIGGAWGADDVILVASDTGNSLDRVAAVGGVLTPLTRGRWPHFLPDGRRFLFERAEGIWVGSVAAGDAPRPIVDSNARKPAYSNGHLLFARDRKLMAQRFDPGTLRVSGEAYPVAEVMFGMIDNPVEFSVTAGGLLAYANGERQTTLVWRDRTGKRLDELASSGEPGTPRISPDGRRVAFARTDGTNTDIWIADLGRRSTTRLTFDAAIDRFPVWSPDGATITYASGAASNAGLYRRAADGSGGAERLTTGPSAQHPMDWAMNNRVLSFTRNELAMGTNLMVLSAGVEHTFLRTIVSEAHSQLDPKAGRWIAYSSDDSGRREIYVMPFQPDRPAGDARWQLSTAGGTMPRWRRDGGELYYRGLDGRIMAAAVDGSGPAFKWSAPQPLFQTVAPTMRTNDIEFDVTPDGQRFLLVEPSDRAESQPLMVNTDWLATLKGTSR